MKRLTLILLLLSFAMAPYAQQRKSARRTTAKKTVVQSKKTRKSGKTSTAKKATTTPSVQSLQSQRQKIQQKIKEQEQRLRTNQRDVNKRLQNLMIINTEIEGKRRAIDTIRRNISQLLTQSVVTSVSWMWR